MGSWEGIVRRLWSPRPSSANIYELLSTEPGLPTSARRNYSPSPSALSRRAHAIRRVLFTHPRLVTLLHYFTFRRIAALLASIPVFLAVVILWQGVPPTYARIRAFERALPQHNRALPPPEGAHGVYLRFPGHLWGHGLNNVLQEVVMMSHLAYLLNRSYVFEDYTWSHTPLPYTIYDLALRPARIPLNAFIAGPAAGGPMRVPRAVSAEFYELVCPPSQRVSIPSTDAPKEPEAGYLLEWWAERLKGIKEGCLEVGNDPPLFDWDLFGSERILSAWPSLSKSPIVADFAWSPLVVAAVARNFALFHSPSPLPFSSFASLPDSTDAEDLPARPQSLAPSSSDVRSTILRGLVALHLRRGDYARHCPRLAGWRTPYNGLNHHPLLPDRFVPPPPHPSSDDGEASEDQVYHEYYEKHCWPSIEQIVEKLREVRVDYEMARDQGVVQDKEEGSGNGGGGEREERVPLSRIFLLTNGWGVWVNALSDALRADGWADVRSSYDLELDAEQKYVAAAVDMAIAERAEVFVGNGFSSLTSNIVMLRLAKQLDPQSIRFW